MVGEGLTLAILTTAGCVMVYQKMPRKVRRFMEKHALMTDIIALLLTYMFLGGTLTALTAAAFVGIFTSILLHIVNNQDDYLYLFDFAEMVKSKLAHANKFLKKYGEEYRNDKELKEVANVPG